MPDLFVVIGASGRTGRLAVKELIRRSESSDDPLHGCRVRATCRSPKDLEFEKHACLETMAVDVTDKDSVRAAVRGSKGVIFAAQGRGWWSAHSVDYAGARRVAKACKDANARLVLISSALVSWKNYLHPIRLITNTFIRFRVMDCKRMAEGAIRDMGVEYVIVRPGGLNSKEAGHLLNFYQGDSPWHSGVMPRSDLAKVCVEALVNPNAANATFEVFASDSQTMAPEGHIEQQFRRLHPDEANADEQEQEQES